MRITASRASMRGRRAWVPSPRSSTLEALMPYWTWFVPAAAAGLLASALLLPPSALLQLGCGAALIGAVIASVHHAEVVAHRVGEPFGTLVLAIAITVIEVALILSIMLGGGPDSAVLARDTIFATVMIIVNGVVGICLLVGAMAHREQAFRIEGAGPALAALVTLATLALVLPTFTTSSAGGTYTDSQLLFEAVVSIAVWAVFVFVQTVRHRDYFLPTGAAADPDAHAEPPSRVAAWTSFGLLIVSLGGVVGLAKVLSPSIEAGSRCSRCAQDRDRDRDRAARAAARDLGRSAPGSRQPPADQHEPCARLGAGEHRPDDPGGGGGFDLARPAAGARARAEGQVLLALTFVVGTITLGTGRTTLMQGAVHLVIFAAFLFLALVP